MRRWERLRSAPMPAPRSVASEIDAGERAAIGGFWGELSGRSVTGSLPQNSAARRTSVTGESAIAGGNRVSSMTTSEQVCGRTGGQSRLRQSKAHGQHTKGGVANLISTTSQRACLTAGVADRNRLKRSATEPRIAVTIAVSAHHMSMGVPPVSVWSRPQSVPSSMHVTRRFEAGFR